MRAHLANDKDNLPTQAEQLRRVNADQPIKSKQLSAQQLKSSFSQIKQRLVKAGKACDARIPSAAGRAAAGRAARNGAKKGAAKAGSQGAC